MSIGHARTIGTTMVLNVTAQSPGVVEMTESGLRSSASGSALRLSSECDPGAAWGPLGHRESGRRAAWLVCPVQASCGFSSSIRSQGDGPAG